MQKEMKFKRKYFDNALFFEIGRGKRKKIAKLFFSKGAEEFSKLQ